MDDEKKYEFYDPEYDTYTFRGEILRSVTVGFEAVYRSESYEIRRRVVDCGYRHPSYLYEVFIEGEGKIMPRDSIGLPVDLDAYDLVHECERVEMGR